MVAWEDGVHGNPGVFMVTQGDGVHGNTRWIMFIDVQILIIIICHHLSIIHCVCRAGFMALLIAELTMMLVVITGLVMYAVYLNCDPMMSGRIQQADQVSTLPSTLFGTK